MVIRSSRSRHALIRKAVGNVTIEVDPLGGGGQQILEDGAGSMK
jgi:hypothetical protein